MASSPVTAAVCVLLQSLLTAVYKQQYVHVCYAMPSFLHVQYVLLPSKACVQQSPVALTAAGFQVLLLAYKQSQHQLLAMWHPAQGQEQRQEPPHLDHMCVVLEPKQISSNRHCVVTWSCSMLSRSTWLHNRR